MDIEKIYDMSAIRIMVPEITDCYKILGIIHGAWRPLPDRIKDYIASPKLNGYKSIHTTIYSGDGGIIEVQIRTENMHKEGRDIQFQWAPQKIKIFVGDTAVKQGVYGRQMYPRFHHDNFMMEQIRLPGDKNNKAETIQLTEISTILFLSPVSSTHNLH